jgi:two-component system invasion response regulator UvrY
MIKVLVADDHPIVRQGIQKIVDANADMRVVAESIDGPSTIDTALRDGVDVVLLDLSMPGLDGLDVLKCLKCTRPQLPVLILTMHSEDQFAMRALKTGASGYLTKEAVPDELVRAIRTVVGGRRYISQTLGDRLAASIVSGEQGPPHERLSNREYQVFRRIAAGRPAREISLELGLSVKTVATYRARILEKMEMKTNAELVTYTVRHHLAD